MMKIIYLLAIYLALGHALDKLAEITKGEIHKIKDYDGVDIESSGGKTEITWNESVNAEINPLKATFFVRYTSVKKADTVNLENICETYKKGSLEEVVRIYILKSIANVDACPIKKGTKAIFNVPSNYSYYYSINDNKCGPFQAEMKMFRKKEHPIILGSIEGNITGCK